MQVSADGLLHEIDEDPLVTVMQDLTKLNTGTASTTNESQISCHERNINDAHTKPISNQGIIQPNHMQDEQTITCNNVEDIEDSIGTPDSLEFCQINERPIPPPRTRLPPPLSTTENKKGDIPHLQNGNTSKHPRSESDHELLMSLTVSGNCYIHFIILIYPNLKSLINILFLSILR